MNRSAKSSQLLLAALCLIGCATPSVSSLSAANAASLPAAADRPADNDLQRLTHLWEVRTKTGLGDYPLGPGDVIEISVPAIDELKDRTERISGDRKLSLPYIGSIQVSEMTEKDLKVEIIRHLTKYMYDPQVDVFVKQYRSRQVAVIGAVAKPGLYDLASGHDTILDMISQAGGMREDAAQRALLIPAEESGLAQTSSESAPEGRFSASPETAKVSDPAATMSALVASNQLGTLLRTAKPIVIDTRNLARGGNGTFLALPARPQDVIFVPSAGEVLVQGWVNKPGNYRITPGLTVLGALAAAGGPLFAADQRAVKIARSGPNGEKLMLTADLRKITAGQESDLPVEEGDVVDVSYSPVKLVPYAFYSLLNRAGFGAMLPVPP